MKEVKFFYSKSCGSLVYLLEGGDCKLSCCGEEMQELKAGTTDAAVEKHVPQVSREGNHLTVQVGSVLHPMEEKHYIQCVVAVQGCKVQIKHLAAGQEPKACFEVCDGPVEVYEFCNLHGLWKTEA